jgi:hypothetical protein
MPVKSAVVNDGSLIVERWTGAITRAELLEQARALARDDRVQPGAVKFSDFRAASLHAIGLEALEALAAQVGRRHVRTGLLIHERDWSRARAAEAQVELEGLEVACFNLLGATPWEIIATACQWLGVDPDQVAVELARLVSG